MEVEHPAAKIIVELSQRQDKEIGDGTTSIVLIAAELLRRAQLMIENKIHPNLIIAGYKQACKLTIKHIKENLMMNVNDVGFQGLINVAITSMSSKFLGAESDIFAKIAYKAVNYIKSKKGKVSLNNIHQIKMHGKSSLDSKFFMGLVMRMSRVSQ